MRRSCAFRWGYCEREANRSTATWLSAGAAVPTVNSARSTSALHRIPPGANAAHTLVIAVDHLQRCVVRLRSWHRRVWRRIWRRWSFTQRFEQPLVPPKAADGFQLDRLPARADFAATPSMLDQEVRRRAHVE